VNVIVYKQYTPIDFYKMDENLTNLNMVLDAAGDGRVNGTSMPMNRVLRIRFLVHGNGAGDPAGIIFTTVVNRTRTTVPLMIVD